MKRYTISLLLLLNLGFLASCESDAQRKLRLYEEEQEATRLEQLDKAEQERQAQEMERLRIEQEAEAERKRIEQLEYEKYINNTLQTGRTPYARYYGGNSSCNSYGCSQIKVQTSNSDVVVTIKKNGRVYRHAYISSGDQYTFSFPDGTYQAFFYYGKGWNPNKEMKGGKLKGGFITDEAFGKDEPQLLQNSTLTYELKLQTNGNFQTLPSDPDEAL